MLALSSGVSVKMGRKRMIDSDGLYFDSKLVKSLGEKGLLVYIRLWALAEDSGVYLADYDDIAYQMGALDITGEEIKQVIIQLIKLGKVIRYTFKGIDREYHYLRNFHIHQKLSNPIPPRHPLPPWIKCEINTYKSGKKYAKFDIDLCHSSLPVHYQSATSRLPVDDQSATSSLLVVLEEKGIELEENRTRREGKDLLSPDGSKGDNQNNEDNNNPEEEEDKDNSKKRKQKEFPVYSIEYQLAKMMLDEILKNLPSFTQPKDNLQKWSYEMDKIIRIDKKPPEQVSQVIRWCQRDSFWSGVVQAPVTLRKHYDKLLLKMQKDINFKGQGTPYAVEIDDYPVDGEF